LGQLPIVFPLTVAFVVIGSLRGASHSGDGFLWCVQGHPQANKSTFSVMPSVPVRRSERQRRSGFQVPAKRLWWRRFASGEVILYKNVKGLSGY
jgi:hypothetical protein